MQYLAKAVMSFVTNGCTDERMYDKAVNFKAVISFVMNGRTDKERDYGSFIQMAGHDCYSTWLADGYSG